MLDDADPVTLPPASELDQKTIGRVTPLTGAERARLFRQRRKAKKQAATRTTAVEPMLFSTPEWMLFTDLSTLPQKAGCSVDDLPTVVLKELVDNALDAGARVELQCTDDGRWIIGDDGPGIDPEAVPGLFSINRNLLSSKAIRRPSRGMLGNGLRVVAGAVAATGGTLAVSTRGRRLELQIDRRTGLTTVVGDDRAQYRSITVIEVGLPVLDMEGADEKPRKAIAVASCGTHYEGPSSPWWYSARELERLLRTAPTGSTVGKVCQSLGSIVDDDRPASSLSEAEAALLLATIRSNTKPIRPEKLGELGRGAITGVNGYAKHSGTTTLIDGGAEIPFVLEVWASCLSKEEKLPVCGFSLYLNRSPTIADIIGWSSSKGIYMSGCGFDHDLVTGTRAGTYSITISLITPHVNKINDGKEPDLNPFWPALRSTIQKVARQAYNAMVRPPGKMNIKKAAYSVMTLAYMETSDNGRLPANPRQIMYKARPEILKLTGKTELKDTYFTQTLLPDYMNDHPEECADWRMAWDARGHLTEPHTGRRIELGSRQVWDYVKLSRAPDNGGDLGINLPSPSLYPTHGPRNRYRFVLYIEKEGFEMLMEEAQIPSRYDIAVMSNKGLSATASRYLIDHLADMYERVFVLHDFDVTGFSIYGTLGTDGRRHKFKNKPNVEDLGLRWADVQDLEPEPTVRGKNKWNPTTLRRHGATQAEIDFLKDKRVELNAMTSQQLIDFIERKFAESGVEKVVPDIEILERQARRTVTALMARPAVNAAIDQARRESAQVELPADLEAQVRQILRDNPSLAWDVAIVRIVKGMVA